MSAAAKESLVPGEYVMTADDLRRIAALLHADSGIVVNESKASLVYSRLTKRLRALGLESFRSYCALVSGEDGADERVQMLSALTTNLTRFYREPHHFEHLKTRVLPRLAERARRGGRVRLWSAACSNGAEAYSIGLSVLEAMPDVAAYDVRVLATDIDFRMVEAARQGVYDAEQVKPIPTALRDRWMTPLGGPGGRFGAGEELRRLVAFRELNLIGDWPMRGRFDAIFCRNVCIYFEEATQNRLWARFADVLTEEGRLYIGHSERIGGPAAGRLRYDGVTTFAMGRAA